MNRKKEKTCWSDSANWYNKLVGERGHYYHREVIFPKLLPLMNLKKGDSLLDLGCGQGVLSRVLPKGVEYFGIDAAKPLLERLPEKSRMVHDVTKPFDLKRTFSHASIILALQNMSDLDGALQNARNHLEEGGELFIVLNHPHFRVPRQSSWGVDEKKKLQYRRIDSYMSPLKVPIQMHPGQEKSESTLSFHYPLSHISLALCKAGFTICGIEEWCSNKESLGKMAKMENRARDEIPLFMMLKGK